MSFFGGFPFGGFGSSGFHGHDDDDQQPGQVDNNKFYQVLGVSKNATQAEIKKAYLNLAKIHHPDRKGGNAQKFKQISQAYQTLGDAQKKRLYDKYGSKGPREDGSDLLNMFFGGGGGRNPGKKQLPKVKPTKKALQITLQNVYNGDMMKIPNKRTRCCQGCKGKGGQNIKKCTTCKGRGQVVQMYQMGPGMYQQVQKRCDACKGQGEIIGQGGKCKICLGNKIVQKQKVVEVAIEKGTPNNHPIVLSGQGNQIPDALAGDLIFVVQQKPHAIFTRKGADLYMKKTISLVQALTGFDFTLKHLDDSQILISTDKGEVIGDGDKKIVKGLGLPFFKDPMSSGNLIIEFSVAMPKRGQLNANQLEILGSLLPGKVNVRPVNNQYEMLEDFDIENANTNQEGGRKPAQQQQEQMNGNQGIGCASQ